MKLKIKLVNRLQHLILISAPLVVGLTLSVSSTLAATLASSKAQVAIENFSYNPQSVLTSTDTDTLAIANSGTVTAEAIADAIFLQDPASASNYSLSTVSGSGSDYFGLAQSFVEIGGFNISVNDQGTFSFDFSALLDLKTSIDNPQSERASASGSISFLLFDSTNENNWSLLDSFVIFSNLSTPENNDNLAFGPQNSSAFTLNPSSSLSSSFGGNNELASASISGKYSRYFATSTRLSLVGFNATQSAIPVPVPSNLLGVVSAGLFLLYKVSRKKRFKKPLLEEKCATPSAIAS